VSKKREQPKRASVDDRKESRGTKFLAKNTINFYTIFLVNHILTKNTSKHSIAVVEQRGSGYPKLLRSVTFNGENERGQKLADDQAN